MSINTRAQALAKANRTKTNAVGACQKVTRGYFNAPSAGDRDHDGDADAYDGWLSEPVSKRHLDRNPPAGVPVAFKGGSKGYGHRAISLGGGHVRSTDFNGLTKRYQAGVVGNGTIAEVERAMGVRYLGWSETIDGQVIPEPPKPIKTSRGKHVDAAIISLSKATATGKRGSAILEARKALESLPKTH